MKKIMNWLIQYFAFASGRLALVNDRITRVERDTALERTAGPLAVFVLDASSSMDRSDWPPTRLDAAKDAAKAYVRRLSTERCDAFVAVVSYATDSERICDPIRAVDHELLDEAIDRIEADGVTNITAGLREAFTIVSGHEGPCQVLLLSDGAHNHGPKPHATARRLRKAATLESIGIGGSPDDVKADLLKAISSAYPDGSKRYRWIGDRARLVKEFTQLAGRIARA